MSNKRIKNIRKTLLSDNFYILNNVTFDYQMKSGEWVTQSREVYDRGHGAGIFLYNKKKRTILLVKQFRIPTLETSKSDGFLVEICAGMLDEQDPETCIKREVEEETGYKVKDVKKVYEGYSSPGVMTEKMHFFIGEYTESMKLNEGGGLDSEHEDIQVLELPFSEAVDMLNNGRIHDTRTIVLLQYAIIHKLLD